MNNQSHPQDGTAGFGRGPYNGNGNGTNAFAPPYVPAISIMTTGGDWNHLPNSYYPSGTVFATGGATGFVPEIRSPHLEGYGDAGRTTLESRMALQNSPHSEPWNPVTAVHQPSTAVYGHDHRPMYPANMQLHGHLGLLPVGNPAAPSQTGNSNRSTQCEQCGSTLGTPREWQRHMRTVHGAARYMCKCVYSPTRKDNYTRHLTKFCKMKHETGRSFFCICGVEHSDLDEHLTHVKRCGKQQAGRRSNGSQFSVEQS